jgi:hypothetical protein
MKNNKTKKAVAVAVLSSDQVNHVNQIVDMIADADKHQMENAEVTSCFSREVCVYRRNSPTYELWTALSNK